jgi:drug/metabolite transporter (DMT)-like permease
MDRFARFSISIEKNEISLELLWNCLVYTIAAASEYWLLNWLKYSFDIKLAIFCAMLQNASWPIQAIVYYFERKTFEKNNGPREITPFMYRSYFILGALNAVITLTRTIGLTSLPPTIYVIIANTEIVFEAFMTVVVLRRKISAYQIVSVVLVIAGVMIALYDPKSNKYGSNEDVSHSTLVVGVIVSLASRFCSSLNTVLADRFLGKDRKTRMGVLECSLANAIIPSFFLPVALLAIPEYHRWSTLLHRTPSATAVITLLCVTITLAKHADRLSKFSIVSQASTMFYAIVDSNMKIIAGIGAIFLFSDTVSWPQDIGYACIFFSLLFTCYDKKVKYDLEMAAGDNNGGPTKNALHLASEFQMPTSP